MRKHVFNAKHELIRVEDAEPECGEDFCDLCGDCLACYGDYCVHNNDGAHYWVEYEDEDEVENKEKNDDGRTRAHTP